MPLGGALTLGGIGAGASLFGSKNASNAAKTAAQLQQQSINQAQQFGQQAFQQQQQALSPYRQAGQYALANLMAKQYGGTANQYGPPSGYGAPPSQMPQVGQQNLPAGALGTMNIPGRGYSIATMQPPQGAGMPPQWAGTPPAGPMQQPMQQPQGGMPPPNATGPMVTVQAPTGETMQLSPDQAQLAVSRGARILGQ